MSPRSDPTRRRRGRHGAAARRLHARSPRHRRSRWRSYGRSDRCERCVGFQGTDADLVHTRLPGHDNPR
ncbi:hypothetical protein I552_0836 [Mycobacterium xenopi 3993]|nr:hypothetical protein I552_0836 [Mycobacterium xenopi 3993]